MDTNTLIALAAPIVALIGSIATLIGVRFTLRNNRKLKEMELEHSQKLKEMELEHQLELRQLELRSDAARLVRAERRSVYLELLRMLSNVLNFWLNLREYGVEEDYPERSREVQAQINAYAALLPELTMCGSDELRRKSRRLVAALYNCTEVLLDAAEAQVTNLSDKEEFEAGWQRAVDAALQEYDDHEVTKLYREVMTQIKDEMGSLVLQSDFAPERDQSDMREQGRKVEAPAETGSTDVK